jgi:hypothetical protein
MKKDLLWIAAAALLLPILARLIWFYPGVPSRPEIATPDYQSLSIPQAPIETPDSEEKVKQRGGVVLVDYTHTNQFQPAEIQSLNDTILQRGGRVETLTDATALVNKLKYASAYVVISPSIAFSTEEMRLVRLFVERGGRLAVFTDATRGLMYFDYFSGNTLLTPDVNAVNPLLASFDLTINNDYLYNLVENESNFRNVYFDEFGKDALTFGLKRVALYGTHSVESDTGLVLLQGSESTFSSGTDAHNPAEGGAALSESGNVVAFGDFTFLTPPYNQVADNATLIANLADFLLGGRRTFTLAAFPYVFSQPMLQVLPTSEVQMTAELIAALGRLQTALQLVDISTQIVTEAPDEGDTLVLGTFTPSDDLLPFLEPFNDFYLDDVSEYITVPGFGNVGRYGNGILLFNTGKRGNTLVLLADSVDELTTLLDTVSGGSFYGCLLQGNIGVCSIGYGGSFSEENPSGEESPSREPVIGEATPTPIPSPAPGG